MVQLKQTEFIKRYALTEMAFTMVNNVWPDIEAYFDAVDFDSWVDTYTMKDTFVDLTLQKYLYSYFRPLLQTHKLTLKVLNLVFDMGGPQNEYGSAEVLYETISYGTESKPTVIINININRVFSVSKSDFMRILFHELSHVEQQCKILFGYGVDKLLTELPENEPVPVASLASSKGMSKYDDSMNFSAVDELGAYANDFALKLFYYYKQDLKSLPAQERDLLVRSKILPEYLSSMSNDMKEQFNSLAPDKRNRFLKQLVKQMEEFISRLS